MKIDDIDFGQSCLLARGKGNKERVVPFGIHARRALWRYIRDYRPDPIFLKEASVFLSEGRFSLRPRSVQSMIPRICGRSGITGVRCSPHTLRHTFARLYLMEGGDVFSLQKTLSSSALVWPSMRAQAVLEYEDREVLCEDSGQPTSIDLVIGDPDKSGALFIECTFTENGFGGCSVFGQGDCEGSNPASDFSQCYLHHLFPTGYRWSG